MKFTRNIPFFFLFAAVLFGAVGLLLQVSVQRELLEAPEREMAREVRERVQNHVEQARQELTQLASALPVETGFFSKNLVKASLPVFIFQKNKLVFWSDHTLRPELDLINLRREVEMQANRFGRFLTVTYRPSGTYTLVAVIPLEIKYGISNTFLHNGLNPVIFEDHAASLQAERSKNAVPVVDAQGNYLFSIIVMDPADWLHASKWTFALYALALLMALLFLLTLRRRWKQEGHLMWSLWSSIIGVIALRGTMLLFNFPNSVLEMNLFSPRVYAAGWWSPSLGDLLLNELCLLAIAMQVYWFCRAIRFQPDFQKTGQKQIWASIGLGTLITLVIISWYETYSSIGINTQPTLDISKSVSFSLEKTMIFLVMVMHTLALSWVLRLLLNWLPFSPGGKRAFAFSWVTVLAMALVWAFWRDAPSGNWVVLLASATLVGWEQLHRELGRRAGIYSSVFLLNILGASLGAAALYDLHAQQHRQDKQRVVSQLLKDRDDEAEYFLAQAAEEIGKDPMIRHVLRAPWINLNFLDQKIRRQYLQNLEENYAITLRLFDINGQALSFTDTLTNWHSYARYWAPKAKNTNQKGQLLIKSETEPGKFTYLQEIRMAVNPVQWMTLVLEVTPKLAAPNSVLPELLVERKSSQPNSIPGSSYGLWRNGRWLKTEGYFEYSRYFSPQLFQVPLLFSQGLTLADYHHLGAVSGNGTVAVVSTPAYGFRSWLSNFSFQFLVHTLVLFALLAVVILYRGRLVQVIASTFGTKIQLFLNLGILVPLVIVSLTIGSLVTDSYRQDMVRSYLEQGEFVRQNIQTSNWGHTLFKSRPDSLSRRVSRLAALAQSELNFYDAQGQLRISSQPALFEAGVISTRLNPQAISVLKEQGLNRVLLQEKAGSLPYSAIYVPLRNSPTESPQGYLGIPFFDAEKELNAKLIQLITTILNIFTVLFLVFVLVSYAATRALTVPLKLLTDRLKRTTLTGQNEKLVYESSDEIGLLVREYNQMLQKLEESKQELALREKEAAWKEMARQVAHEIKNPLTPMKLSLQYLRKAMQEGRSNMEELVEKISKTMITQIDVLGDIATSFSNFTSMPDLKLEVLELNDLVKRAADLHLNPQQHRVQLEMPPATILVKADENQLIRIFNNLLLNALQAVPSSRRPEIQVRVQPSEPHWVLVAVQDNGSGIPPEVQPKIFVPNFSTKYSGSGIGLAVVRKGVEAIGGSIWFETEENVGTTFFLKLPVVQP
ncbi:sensor histidine kinase [Rufibacter quisquiliarum]|uniref:histidine kinase n=1 Tax=Rufibacter quisquiliarum TaxID=1549639 RepID=A0A839GMC4_9BACT|nr:HAMP domain-containing sensor histidine kinase [Rufibacter quisquiliarum]MBA9079023.1 signal transduction histidine kinase [Rufibacter quisquiliarum]